ncbi:MAG TPA: S1 RNA-binding domain-containing protein [Bacteroidia bacterium]|nr:S1 RNA-binding domain-containing protein [Bacteroidota bacterium]HRC31847.1 S1 RNA-binding domain-containing protein [Bacteroidia bacterium]
MRKLSDNQKRFIKTLKPGQVVNAKIMSFSPHGTFVKIGIVNGLLRNSDISHDPVHDAEEVLAINQRRDVVILKVDYENYTVQVGIKQLLTDPWTKFLAKYKVGSGVVATVKNIMEYGVFFHLIPGISGLLHNSEIKKHNLLPSSFEVDEVHQLLIKNIDEETRKIELEIET